MATCEELRLVDQAVRPVPMQMPIREAEDRIWWLRRTHRKGLASEEYREILETNPRIAINRFHKRLKLLQLNRRMLDIIVWMKKKDFHKEAFRKFVRKVANQAKKIQREKRLTPSHERQLWKEDIPHKTLTCSANRKFIRTDFGPRPDLKERENKVKDSQGRRKGEKEIHIDIHYASPHLIGEAAGEIT